MNNQVKIMTANPSMMMENGKSPFVIEYMMVICSGLRHMAYRDDAGKWRDAYNRQELRGPVKILG